MQKELLPYMGLGVQFQFSIYSTVVSQKETTESQEYRIWRMDVKNLGYSEASSTCKENKYQNGKFTLYNHAMVFTLIQLLEWLGHKDHKFEFSQRN